MLGGGGPLPPGAPKRAVSAYMNFVAMMRPMVLVDNPDMGFGDIGKELGKLWGALTEEQKAEYKSPEDSSADAAAEEASSFSSNAAHRASDAARAYCEGVRYNFASREGGVGRLEA